MAQARTPPSARMATVTVTKETTTQGDNTTPTGGAEVSGMHALSTSTDSMSATTPLTLSSSPNVSMVITPARKLQSTRFGLPLCDLTQQTALANWWYAGFLEVLMHAEDAVGDIITNGQISNAYEQSWLELHAHNICHVFHTYQKFQKVYITQATFENQHKAANLAKEELRKAQSKLDKMRHQVKLLLSECYLAEYHSEQDSEEDPESELGTLHQFTEEEGQGGAELSITTTSAAQSNVTIATVMSEPNISYTTVQRTTRKSNPISFSTTTQMHGGNTDATWEEESESSLSGGGARPPGHGGGAEGPGGPSGPSGGDGAYQKVQKTCNTQACTAQLCEEANLSRRELKKSLSYTDQINGRVVTSASAPDYSNDASSRNTFQIEEEGQGGNSEKTTNVNMISLSTTRITTSALSNPRPHPPNSNSLDPANSLKNPYFRIDQSSDLVSQGEEEHAKSNSLNQNPCLEFHGHDPPLPIIQAEESTFINREINLQKIHTHFWPRILKQLKPQLYYQNGMQNINPSLLPLFA